MHLHRTLLTLLPTLHLTTAQSPPSPATNPILDAITSISAHTTTLNTTVSTWTGSPLTLLAITAQSASLLASIHAGTHAASRAANLTLDQTLAVASATITLATDVNQTITTIIDAKEKFDRLVVADPVVLLNLKLERDAAREFGGRVVDKVPSDLQGVAEGLVGGIDDSFAEGIAAFEVL